MTCPSRTGHTEKGTKVGPLEGADVGLAAAVLFTGTEVGRLDPFEVLLTGDGRKPELIETRLLDGELVGPVADIETLELGANELEVDQA